MPEAGIADGDPLSIGSFLYDRIAFSVARLPLTKVRAERLREFMEEEDGPALSYNDNDSSIVNAQDEEVTVMAGIYDDLTEYRKPLWVSIIPYPERLDYDMFIPRILHPLWTLPSNRFLTYSCASWRIWM